MSVGILAFAGCGQKANQQENAVEEDAAAKKMLQGVWLNEEEDDVAFRVEGDTIYYPDSTSMPTYFYIADDTLVMRGSNLVKYPIVKQAQHLFEFKVQNGDVVKLVKTQDKAYLRQFANAHSVAVSLNQNTLVKRDTVVKSGDESYHLYTQVNPTTYKVYKSSFNDDGVEVDNVYYDNIVNLHVYRGASRLFSRDFHKKDFAKAVPAEFLKQAILSDIVFLKTDTEGIHYQAVLAMPDSNVSYQVEIVVSKAGKMTIRKG